ncbi:YwaF family protein [Psychroserpens ponticola]|uniref:TIGR02206 family membrane protein n=1 Tax=Psychroserpens ponticola TaxID=2932268 RepID=A0ABY7S0B0_9FLAO|nr:TIGR02206 family membrane protein [Psychroserpens ponticola]WCO02405.1 TIGR02206 family membrane protein [Psychroserpens ponticola]
MHFLTTLLLQRVAIGSLEHLIPIGIAIVFSVLFIRFAKQSSNQNIKVRLFNGLAVFVSLSVFSFHLYYFGFESYNIKTDLPLYLCSLIALLIPIFSYNRKYWMFEILVFWIIAGTLQGVITPDIVEGFPSFDYFRYWIVHLGLLSIIFYAVFVFEMKPRFNSVFISFFALQLYVVFMVIINFVLDANYFYLNQKPESASLLDYFGEWPYYIIITQLIIIPFFFIIYLGFNFICFKKKR